MTDTSKKPAPGRTAVQMVEVDADRADQRIDNFLLNILGRPPKSLVYRLLRTGQVRVNGKRIKPLYRLQAGDQVRIPPVAPQDEKPLSELNDTQAKRWKEACLYEDDQLLVINKPTGIAVHGGTGVKGGMIEQLRLLYGESCELIHRLDRDTSGCILIAKTRKMLCAMHELIREGQISKQYHLIVSGQWPARLNKVSMQLKKNQLSSGERMVRAVKSGGKESLTTFAIVENLGQRATYLKAHLKTGRTHQLRVHTQVSGYPIVGDPKYGDKAVNRWFKQSHGLNRLCLHAHTLKFVCPITEKKHQFTASLSTDMERLLTALRSA